MKKIYTLIAAALLATGAAAQNPTAYFDADVRSTLRMG